MRPAGMRWVMGCRFEAGPGASSVLAATRPTGRPAFDVKAVDDLARVSVHFRRAPCSGRDWRVPPCARAAPRPCSMPSAAPRS